jgi:hypothetical protein
MRVKICGLNNPEGFFCVSDLGYVSKITKAQFRRLDLHILVEKPRRSTTAPVFSSQSASRSSKTASF